MAAPGAVPGGLALGGAALLLLLVPAAVAQEPLPAGCAQYTNRSCEECLKNVSCLWCNTDKACLDYPVRKILPPASLCDLSSARWGVCWVNFKALIITISVLGGAVLLGIAVCCCYCCRRKKSRKADKSDERAMREQEERRARQEERRAEMKSRHDEIRKKYGGSENRERPHQPEGGRAGRLCGAVQDQEAHPTEQADEGLLRETGLVNEAD